VSSLRKGPVGPSFLNIENGFRFDVQENKKAIENNPELKHRVAGSERSDGPGLKSHIRAIPLV